MEILGSAYQVFAVGNNTLNMPRSGLTVVGITVSNNGIQIPIDSSRNAILYSGEPNTFNLIPVTFQLANNELNYVGLNGGGLLIVYYGIPDSDEPPLEEYSAVTVSIIVNIGTATGLQTPANGNVNFPSSKYVMKAIQILGTNSTDGTATQFLASFAISPGELVTYGGSPNEIQVPYGMGSVIPVADLPAPDQLTVIANIYMFVAATAAGTGGVTATIYYGLANKPSKLGSRMRSGRITGMINPFSKQLASA